MHHCQETGRHAAVTDVCLDSQRFHLTWFGKRGVAENIRFDSFVDDLSSVDSNGLNYQDCEVLVRIDKQSLDIAGGVDVGKDDLDVGAGDQGTMFGCASHETEDAMTHVGETETHDSVAIENVQWDGAVEGGSRQGGCGVFWSRRNSSKHGRGEQVG